jgi:hypothetical protein
MSTELLTTSQLRDKLETTWLKHIKLCQDNFLYFVANVWPDFIYRKTNDPERHGHHQIIADELVRFQIPKEGG